MNGRLKSGRIGIDGTEGRTSIGGNLLPMLVLSFFLLIPPPAQGAMQTLPPDTAGSWRPLDTLWHDFRSTFTDAWLLFGSPLRFDRTDWIITGSAVGSTLLLTAADEDLRREMQSLRGTDGDHIAEVGNAFGENMTGLLVTGLLYTPGLVLNEPKLRLMGRHIGQTLIYSAAIGSLMKHTLGRHRPFLEAGPYEFSGPWQTDDAFLSLPSGHTTVAFSIASSLAADIDNPWATVGLYGAATLTALSRMYIDRHWSSDVFLAAAISTAVGYGTANLHREMDEGETSHLFLSPTPTGFSLTYAF